jgi:hypothetical protein
MEQPIDGQQAFEDALTHIGFTQEGRDQFMRISGCVDMAMLGLLWIDPISKMCKCVSAALPANLLSTIQEQLLISICFWVTSKQRLQQPIDPEAFIMIVALHQAQIMRQQLKDEQRNDDESTAKAPDKFKTASN